MGPRNNFWQKQLLFLYAQYFETRHDLRKHPSAARYCLNTWKVIFSISARLQQFTTEDLCSYHGTAPGGWRGLKWHYEKHYCRLLAASTTWTKIGKLFVQWHRQINRVQSPTLSNKDTYTSKRKKNTFTSVQNLKCLFRHLTSWLLRGGKIQCLVKILTFALSLSVSNAFSKTYEMWSMATLFVLTTTTNG